jgi:hypothetical protein
MGNKKTLAIAAIAALSICAGAYGIATADGGGRAGHGHGPDRGLSLLAHAAGLNGGQIRAAFTNDATTLKSDFTAKKNARTALLTCLVSGTDCSNQATTYLNAKQTLEKDQLAVWQSLFKNNPNPQNASAVLQEIQQLQASRQQIFHQAFGASTNGDTADE